jgi:hypothetical protein
MDKITNIILLYFVAILPFLYFLYFVIKKAIRDGLAEHDRYKNKI